MKYLIILAIIAHLPFKVKSQSLITDTIYAIKTTVDSSGTHTDTVKYILYRNPATTTTITPTRLSDTASALRTLSGTKQTTLVSGTNIKTVNSNSLLGSGDINISSAVAWGNVTGTLSNQTDLNTALGLKAPLASPTFTGSPVVPGYVPTTTTVNGHALSGNVTVTAGDIGLGNVTNESKSTMFTNPAFTGTTTGITATMVGLGNVTNESKATMFTNATFTGTFTAPNTTITNAMLAGSIDLTTKVTGILPLANGGISGAAAAPATTGTMTINMTSSVITITPTGACTFNASGGVAGQIVTFSITTSGTTSFTLTFGTNFRKVGTLATGTTSARFFAVTFRCIDGTIWQEIGRTAAQT